MTSCKGTWISHFHYMCPELSSPSKTLSVYEFSYFNIYFLACNKSLHLSPLFIGPRGDLWRHARGHEFHIFTILVQNWVLRLKLSLCTNFHVSTFISWGVISLCTFSPYLLVPREIYDVMQVDMNFTFSLYESRIEFSVLVSVRTFVFQRLFLHVSLVVEYLPLFWSQGRFMTSCKGTWISHFHYMNP